MSLPILTITLNPALDLTGSLSVLRVGGVNQISSATLHPAGKGVNVAQVLSDLGHSITVSGCMGTENDGGFVELFDKQGATDQFVRVPGATRINVKMVEGNGEVTDLNFPGISVSAADKQVFEDKLLTLAEQHELIVIAGSLPAGLTPEDLAHWLRLLASKGKKVILDTSREAFRVALDATPWLVKPNNDELEEWIGHALESEAELMAAGEMIAAKGIAHVVISRGADGVLWLHNGQWLKAQPPRMDVVSTVGAGDTLVAGFCHGFSHDHSREQTLRFATALSALAVSQINVGVSDIRQVEEIVSRITVSEIAQ